MLALILAGGLGTRLGKITERIPKVMVGIKGRPFLEYLIQQLKIYNIEKIILCTGHLKEKVKNYFGNGAVFGVNISYSEENKPFGTGGALKFAQNLVLENDFIVMNGDSLFAIDLVELMNFHFKKNALATIALAKAQDSFRYGSVSISKDNELQSFVEKEGMLNAHLINGGIYIFNKKILDFIPKGKNISLEKDIFPKLIGKGFYGFPFDSFFVDIGIPEDYEKVRANPKNLLKSIEFKRRNKNVYSSKSPP